MRPRHRYWVAGQRLHGGVTPTERHVRDAALLGNIAPWHLAVAKRHGGWRSPAERLNQHRYRESWLENLLIAASLGGYRIPDSPKRLTIRKFHGAQRKNCRRNEWGSG